MLESFKLTVGNTTCNRAFACFSCLSSDSMYWGVAFRLRFDGWLYVLDRSQCWAFGRSERIQCASTILYKWLAIVIKKKGERLE